MNKRMRYMLIGLAIVFGGLIAFNIVKNIIMGYFFAHYIPPAVTVSSVIATEKSWDPQLHAVGNFLAINGVDVNAEISGNIVKIYFQSGQYVTKDAPLIDINDSIEQANLKFNQADLALQELNYKRQIELLKTQATAAASVDEALAKLLEAKANIEKIEAIIHQKHIKAPFTGQLGIRMVNLGEYITPGTSAIVTLQSLDPLYIEFYIPEQNLSHIQLDQLVYISVQQYPAYLFKGKITAINPKADNTTHNIKIQATLENCPSEALHDPKSSNKLEISPLPNNNKILISCHTELNTQNNISKYAFIPGMFTSISIEQPGIPKQIVIPSTAISYSLYGDSVFLIEKEASPSKEEILTVRRVFVKTAGEQGNMTLIKKGLKAGQRIVSSGELKLQNGTRVVIDNSIVLDNEPPTNLGE